MPDDPTPPETGERRNPLDPAQLLPEVYDVLRALAEQYMRRERSKTLDPTGLVHEAYLKLAGGRGRDYADRVHFLAVAARAMRQILVDRARARGAQRRGGDALRVTLHANVAVDGPSEDVLALHGAIERLEERDPDAAQVVVYRFFGGLTEVEVAAVMDRSERWVRDQWVFARAWLQRSLAGG